MKHTIILFLILSCAFYATAQSAKKTVNPKARHLEDSAIRMFTNCADKPDCNKKINNLLEQALKIEPKWYEGWSNLISFLGRTDQFDKCPHTPKGVAVDSHGCPLDTDGDGVPDYKDKQLITPTECQPVDADGVGKCPCPEACRDLVYDSSKGGAIKNACGKIKSAQLLFTEVTHISTGMQAQLALLASDMQLYTTCNVVSIGGGAGSKAKEQHAWENVDAVIQYMSDKHQIGRDRFIFKYGEVGDENIVSYRGANETEQGSGNVPPPHPEIK